MQAACSSLSTQVTHGIPFRDADARRTCARNRQAAASEMRESYHGPRDDGTYFLHGRRPQLSERYGPLGVLKLSRSILCYVFPNTTIPLGHTEVKFHDSCLLFCRDYAAILLQSMAKQTKRSVYVLSFVLAHWLSACGWCEHVQTHYFTGSD